MHYHSLSATDLPSVWMDLMLWTFLVQQLASLTSHDVSKVHPCSRMHHRHVLFSMAKYYPTVWITYALFIRS